MTTGYEAFISYASPDLRFAEDAYRRLTAAGFAVWFDKVRLQPGFDWHREIEQACEASRVLLPVLTPHWKLSEWTRFETYGADAVIPLIIDGAPDESFTPPLARFQGHAVDFERLATSATEHSHSRPDSESWEKLFAALRSLLDRPAPDRLARLANVRYRANPYFVGREKELTQIHEQLHQRPTAVLTQGHVQALAALGGVGKTTLARQYVEKFWRCYPQIFWVDCRLGIETELARVCHTLLPEYRALASIPDKARMALRELESRDDRLLVLDNAENERSIQDWIPKTGSCRNLITSRFAGWSAALEVVPLDVLDRDSAHTLLTTRAGHGSFSSLSDSEQGACEELAQELGYLPLALEQAAAYVEQQGAGFGFADYLRLYRVATAELLATGVLGSTEYPDSVITTWKTTTAKLPPAARGILRLCSFLAPTPLPLSVLIDGIDVVCEEAAVVSSHAIPEAPQAEAWIRQQVGQLRAYSMAELDGHSIRFHTLVQTVERLQLDEASGELQATLCRSLKWIDRVFLAGDTQDVRSWPILEPLQRHVGTVVSHALLVGTYVPTDRLLNDLGMLLYAKSQYAESEVLMRKAVDASDRSHGMAHANVGIRLSNLGQVLQAVHRLDEAESIMRRAIQVFREARSETHPHFTTLLNNLATLLQVTNRPVEAEHLLRHVLELDEHAFGGDHPKVAIRLGNLAQVLHVTGRWPEAETLMRRALEIDRRAFGDEHPYVAKDLNNLALWLCDKGEHAQAEPLMRRALSIDEQSYGPHHPHVAIDLGNLAKCLLALNRISEAEPLLRRALSIDESSFGVNHPNVARGLGNLAQLFQRTGQMKEAEPLMERAVTIYETSLGGEHPDLATALNNLAGLYHATARFAEAEPLFRRSLAIDERSLGPNHPKVAHDLNNLASLLQATDRPALAESLYVRALETDERALGADHPSVARDLNNLAQVLLEMNRFEEAESMMRRALSIEERCWGADHPNVAVRLYNLAHVLAMRGRLVEAQPIMARAVAAFQSCSEVAGHEHPYLGSALENYQELLEVMRLSRGR